MGDFDRALRFTLRWEGGFVDDPDDPGGRTNKGITERVYRAYRNDPSADVAHITDAEVSGIYARDYWRPVCQDLPDPLALCAFDAAVNCGVTRTLEWLAHSGWPVSGAVQAARNVNAMRLIRYDKLVLVNPKLKKFLNGWRNRVAALVAEAGLPG